jgi:hypothetical protein
MPSLRESLGAAIDGDATIVGDTDTVVVDEPVSAPPEPSETTETPAEGTLRDGLGRFVAKDAAQTPPATPQAAPGAPQTPPTGQDPGTPAAQPVAATTPAPVSWRAEAKSAWGALPPQVQAEVSRRELEITRTLSETAAARSIASQFNETISPYLPFIRSEGAGSPLEAIRSFMDVAVTLRTGTQFEKARTIAELVKYYDVGIQPLDQALVGEAQEDPQAAMQRQIDQAIAARMAPFEQAAQRARQSQDQRVNAAVAEEMATLELKPHFAEVAPLMADLIDVASRNNIELSAEDAYERALTLHPTTKGATLAARTAQTAAQMNEIAQKAKRASVGGRVQAQSSAVASAASAPLDLRGAITQAMKDVPFA